MPLPAGVRRLCVAYDLENYSTRSNRGQLAAQDRLSRVILAACAATGLAERDYDIQRQGDGGLVVLPTGGTIDEPLLIAAFLLSVESSLRIMNRYLPDADADRIRMRVALHEGILFAASHGYAGDAVVDAFRMCDAPPVRRALALNPGADLVIVASNGLYRDVLRHGDHGLPGGPYVRHELQVKQFSDTGWIFVPGGNAALGARDGEGGAVGQPGRGSWPGGPGCRPERSAPQSLPETPPCPGRGAGTGTDPVPRPDAGLGLGLGSGAQPGVGAGSEPVPRPDAGLGPGLGSGAQPGLRPDAGSGLGPSLGAEPENQGPPTEPDHPSGPFPAETLDFGKPYDSF